MNIYHKHNVIGPDRVTYLIFLISRLCKDEKNYTIRKQELIILLPNCQLF